MKGIFLVYFVIDYIGVKSKSSQTFVFILTLSTIKGGDALKIFVSRF